MAQLLISGQRQLENKLKRIARDGSTRVVRATLSGAVQPYKAAIRRAVTSSSAPPRVKAAARKTIGSSLKKSVGGGYLLKVGFGVGKPSKAKKAAATARARSGRGVGISAQNMHWEVFGTGEQSQLAGTVFKTERSGVRRRSKASGKARTQKTTGKSTGSTPAYFKGLLPATIFTATPAALQKAAIKARIAIQKEAVKNT